eukprot:5149070-Pleurochrysis_carterae.AAC.1
MEAGRHAWECGGSGMGSERRTCWKWERRGSRGVDREVMQQSLARQTGKKAFECGEMEVLLRSRVATTAGPELRLMQAAVRSAMAVAINASTRLDARDRCR